MSFKLRSSHQSQALSAWRATRPPRKERVSFGMEMDFLFTIQKSVSSVFWPLSRSAMVRPLRWVSATP